METIETDIYGEVKCPESLSELMEYINRVWHTYLWRGQSRIDWHLHSGAVRRIMSEEEKKKFLNVSENRVQFYEKQLIENAEKRGFRRYEGRRLTDLELLTLLQHHGAATRLMDFTKNMMVGLWFATEGEANHDKYGLLLGIEVDFVLSLDMNDEINWSNLSVGEIIEHYDENRKELYEEGHVRDRNFVVVWEPPPMFERIIVQHSHFVFSKIVDKPHGSLDVDVDKCLAIAVSPEVKEQMRRLWRPIFNFSRQELFPDLEGFADFNSTSIPPSEMNRW